MHTERKRAKLVFFFSAGVIGIVGLIIGWYQVYGFLESTTFCTQLCHLEMEPQTSAYEISPHAEVTCQGCHIGHSGDDFIKSKLNGVKELVALLANTYHRPIEADFHHLLPSSDTCNHCHWPEKFSEDALKVYVTYLPDEYNTEVIEYMMFEIGTGDHEIANNIHWHMAAELYYIPVDEERREIAWVGILGEEFGYAEYINPEYEGHIEEYRADEEKYKMDCVDCHNRVGHIVYSPEELIDQALYQGKIDKTLPYIKLRAMQALDPVNESLEEAIHKVEAIKEKYKEQYPEVYEGMETVIDKAIEKLIEIAEQTTFPRMKVTWETYIDDSVCGRPELELHEPAGCFRCHGALVATGWLAETHGEQVCVDGCDNVCHYSLYPEDVNIDDDTDEEGGLLEDITGGDDHSGGH